MPVNTTTSCEMALTGIPQILEIENCYMQQLRVRIIGRRHITVHRENTDRTGGKIGDVDIPLSCDTQY